MRLLLDTHLLLWSLAAPERLTARARRLIDEGTVLVSAASIWEISIKSALGRLEADPHAVLAAVEPAGFELLSISAAHAAAVGDLPPLHRDPFDRLLLAQGRAESVPLVTSDAALAAYGPGVMLV